MLKKITLFFLLAAAAFVNAADPDSYQVLWFGDLHYDEPVFHDQTKFKYSPQQLKNFRHYSKIWEEFTPPMMKVAKGDFLKNSQFVIQTGDWIQGDASSEVEKAAQMKKAIEVVTAGINVPFYPVRGNHDARGKGGIAGYKEVILPFINKQVNQEVNSLNYRVVYGKDLYLFIDSLDVDYTWIEKNLAESSKYRWTFIVAHYPLIPPVTTTRWKFGGKRDNVKKLLDLFIANNVILICGDAHEFEYVQYEKDGKKFTQLMANSVMPTKWNDTGFGKADVVKKLREREKDAKIFMENVVEYRAWAGAGFAILRVDDNSVTVDFYARKGYEKPKFSQVVRSKK